MNVALRLVEDLVAAAALAGMVVLPLLEIAVRRVFGVGVPASGPIVQHLVLWVAFLGGAIAARDGKLLALASGTFIPQGPWRRAAAILSGAVASCIAGLLAWGAVQLVLTERETGSTLGAHIPVWTTQLVLPVGFVLVALRLVWHASPAWTGRLLASLGLLAALATVGWPALLEGQPAWPWLAIVIPAGRSARRFRDSRRSRRGLFMIDGVTPAVVRRDLRPECPADAACHPAVHAGGISARGRPGCAGCYASSERGSVGFPAARQWGARSCARSSRCSLVDRA